MQENMAQVVGTPGGPALSVTSRRGERKIRQHHAIELSSEGHHVATPQDKAIAQAKVEQTNRNYRSRQVSVYIELAMYGLEAGVQLNARFATGVAERAGEVATATGQMAKDAGVMAAPPQWLAMSNLLFGTGLSKTEVIDRYVDGLEDYFITLSVGFQVLFHDLPRFIAILRDEFAKDPGRMLGRLSVDAALLVGPAWFTKAKGTPTAKAVQPQARIPKEVAGGAERTGGNKVAPVTSRADFHIQVRSQGYQYHHTTQGGYVLYRHPNGSQIWIRPNGQVIRTGPPVTPSGGGPAYRPRVDASGNPITTHDPNEFVVPLPGN